MIKFSQFQWGVYMMMTAIFITSNSKSGYIMAIFYAICALISISFKDK